MGGLFGGGSKNKSSAPAKKAVDPAVAQEAAGDAKRKMMEDKAKSQEGSSEFFNRKDKLSSSGEKVGVQSPAKLGG